VRLEIDTAAAALMVGVPLHTIRNWSARGHLPPLRTDGTRTIYNAETVARVAAKFGYLPDLREHMDEYCCAPKCDAIAWPDMRIPLCQKHALAVWLRVEDEWHARISSSDRPPYQERPVVYFVQAGDLIKIGTSTSLPSRLETLRTSNGGVLEVLLVVPGNRTQERQVHALFATERVRGEWFRPSERLLAFIADRADQDIRDVHGPLVAQ